MRHFLLLLGLSQIQAQDFEAVSDRETFGTGLDALPELNVKVIQTCAVCVAIAYIWFGCGLAGLFRDSAGYKALVATSQPWYLILAAVLYWLVMPATMLFLAKDADCIDGPSNLGYIIYAGFLVVHVILVILAMCKSKQKMPICDWSKGIWLNGGVLFFFMILDHMDMATDLLFVGSAAACSAEVSAAYVNSWQSIPLIGSELAFTMKEIQLTGLAFFVYVTMAYLPQLLGLTPFAGLCFTLTALGTLLVNLHFGWLAAAIAGAVFLVLLLVTGMFNRQWSTFVQYNAEDEKSLALYDCMGVFDMLFSEDQRNERLLFVNMTKLVFEDMLQLWIQTSFFSLTFDLTSQGARIKSVISMGISLLVLAVKVPALITELRTGPSQVNLFGGLNCSSCIAWVLLLMTIIYGLVILWIAAKIFFAFHCESHLWNLTTGCVDIL